jgi:hypothetical protein
MFDAITRDDPSFPNLTDTKANDRAAIRYALAMTAAVMVFTLAAVIGLATAFPPDPTAPPPWAVQPMPLL